MASILQRAFHPNVIRRSLLIALVVGTVLVVINHGTCVISGKFGASCFAKSLLTVFVPYCVATVSHVLGQLDSVRA